MLSPIAVDFPLRGEWVASVSPAHRVPSHYTHQLGMAYAYDFIQHGCIEKRGASLLRLLGRLPVEQCLGWGATVFSPFDGKVVDLFSTMPDRKFLNTVTDLCSTVSALRFSDKRRDYEVVFGNYMILQSADGYYSLLAHLQHGSIKRNIGDDIKGGESIGRIGHCGSSQGPHLHFQLMDSADLAMAQGLPCSFHALTVFSGDKWINHNDGIPDRKQRIRCIDEQ